MNRLKSVIKIIYWLCFLHVISTLEAKTCPGVDKCMCRKSLHATSIYCKPVLSMDPITGMLRNYFSDKQISYIQLSTCTIRNLTDTTFPSCNITSIKTFCPLEQISNNSFRNIKGHVKLSFAAPVFKEIPQGLQNLPSLESLSFYDHAITSINHELWGLVSLKTLVIKYGGLKNVAEDTFSRSKNLTYLYFSNNRISSLELGTFTTLENLREIDLSDNQLFQVNGLFDNLNPEVIDLYGNNITDISALLHDNMWKVQSLQLGRNSIRNINSLRLVKKVPNIIYLGLSDNKLNHVDVELFQGLKSLSTVSLNFNGIQELPQGIFKNLTKLKTIELQYNFLLGMPEIFTDLPSLETLKLASNKFTSLSGIFRNLTELKLLNVSKNELTRIYQKDFDSVPSIEILDLSSNHINYIDSDTFCNLVNLTSLNISHNALADLNSSLHCLQSLEVLEIEYCHLHTISKDNFNNVVHLKRIVLTGNSITTINDAFNDMPDLEAVSIEKNNLETLSRDTFPKELKINELYMGDNPWACDCRLLWLLNWLFQRSFDGIDILKDDPYCASPPRLQGIALKDLTISNLTVTDTENIPCGYSKKTPSLNGKVIVNFTYEDLLPTKNEEDWEPYLMIAVRIFVFIIFSGFIGYLWKEFSFTVQVWMYCRGMTCLKTVEADPNKEFDVLLSYNSADNHLGQNIIGQKLRSENPPFIVCDPNNSHRNIDPIAAVRMCNKIVVILSAEYLEDNANMTIFHAACNVSREEKVNRLVLIKNGRLPHERKLNCKVKKLLSRRRHMIWGEKMFWDKLFFVFPSARMVHINRSIQDAADDDDEALIISR